MKNNGFTLIELMVVVTIIIILSGTSLAAYFTFSQRQSVNNDARNLSTELRKVQSLARNLVYPSGCSTGLSAYRVFSNCAVDCQSISANAVCGVTEIEVIVNERVLKDTSLASDINISFLVGTGKIDSPTDLILPIKKPNGDYTVIVTVDIFGNINSTKHETYP